MKIAQATNPTAMIGFAKDVRTGNSNVATVTVLPVTYCATAMMIVGITATKMIAGLQPLQNVMMDNSNAAMVIVFHLTGNVTIMTIVLTKVMNRIVILEAKLV